MSPIRPSGHPPQRREAGEGGHRAGRQQRGPLGVQDRPGLGGDLGEHEEHRDVEDADHHQAEAAAGDGAEQQRLHRLAGQHDEQQRVEPLLVLDQPEQVRPERPFVSASAWALGSETRRQRRLGDGEQDREQEQDDDDAE